MKLQKGQRDKLEKYVNLEQPIEVTLQTKGNAIYDTSCFGLDESGKLAGDEYMIFYNQTSSPQGEITYHADAATATFRVQLLKIPQKVQKLSFTISIDGQGSMGEIHSLSIMIKQNGISVLEMELNASDFKNEKAVIALELYRKESWRFAMVGNGFDGGLSALLAYFGGEEEKGYEMQSTQPVEKPKMQPLQQEKAEVKKVSLEKKLEQKAPELVSLAKPLKVQLEKKNLLDCVARVALVIDISGSMTVRFRNGTVQEIVNKTLPLAVQFDDDGELDFWYFGTKCRRMENVNMDNYKKAVPENWSKLMHELGGANNEPVVMNEVIKEYQGSKLPVYVLFISDGGIHSEREIKKAMKTASKYPVFWQFIGVGGSNYGILERLDEMKGRYVDNASFFALDDFKRVSNEELYDRMLEEFPQWLKIVKQKKMI